MTAVRLGRLAVGIALMSLMASPHDAAADTNNGLPKILLHVRSVTTKSQCAGGVVSNCGAATTGGGLAAPGTGPFHFVYVLAAAGSGSLAGVQFGIDYQDSQPGDGLDGQGLDIFDWHNCGTLEFPSSSAAVWPAPGSGNTVTWDPVGACQSGAVAVAGYFYVGAYSPDSLRITVRQEIGVAKVANCNSAETPVFGPDLGFAFFSGPGSPGCNPCLGDCPDFGHPRPGPPPPPPPPPGPPHLGANPDSLHFALNSPDRPPATLTVSNTGGGTLYVQANPGQSWVSATPASHFISGGQSAVFSISVNTTGLAPGSYATTLTLASNDSLDPAHVVPVTVALGPPIVQLIPNQVEMLARIGASQNASVRLRSRGATPLQWTINGLPSWLSLSASSGTTAPGAELTITLTANASGLALGDYRDTLTVHSNDPVRPDQPLPVHLTVFEHTLTVNPDSLHFMLNSPSRPPATLTVTNTGAGPLPVTPRPGQTWLTVTPASHTIAGGQSAAFSVAINSTGLLPGSFATQLTLTGSDPADSLHTVPVTLVLGPPIVQLQPQPFEITAKTGTTRSATEKVTNLGATPLVWSVDGLPPWLAGSPLSGTSAPGGQVSITMTANATSLPPGDYRDTLRVHSNDPIRPDEPLPVRLRVVDRILVVEPDTVDFVLPWHGGTASIVLQIQKLVPVSGQVTLNPTAPWLAVNPVYWSSGGTVTSTFKIDASSFPVGHTETVVPISSVGETVNARVRVDILPTPPDISFLPASVEFQAAEGSGSRTGTVLLRNKGYEPLTFQITEGIPWCHSLETAGSVGPGGSRVVPLVADPTGLTAGTYAGVIEVMSNDPDQPSLSVPVRLVVRPAAAPLVTGGLAIEEVMTACASGDSLPQFVEIRAMGGSEAYRASLGLRIEDAAGVVRYQGGAIAGTIPDGTPWPAGQSFLIGTAAYQSGGVPPPDVVASLRLDPMGGVVTLFDGDPVANVLQRLPYGTRGTNPAPEPGGSLRRLPDTGYALSAAVEPTNRANVSGSGPGCPCTPTRGDFSGRIVYFTTPTADSTYYGHNPNYTGNLRFDLPAGNTRITGDHGFTGLTTMDAFTVRGLDAGTPLTFEARFHFGASGQVNYRTFVQLANYEAVLRTDGMPAAESRQNINYYGWPREIAVDSTLTVVVPATTGRTFPIETRIGGGGEGEGGSAGVGTTTLSFRGLLPGVLLESCWGFEKATPVPVALSVVVAEVVSGQARLEWAGPGMIEPLFVDRRTARDDWMTVGRISPDADGRYLFDDDDVSAGMSYGWRLRGGTVLTAATWLDVPAAGARRLSVSARWDAGGRAIRTRVDWPAAGAAELSVHDVTGRLLARRNLSIESAGTADVSVGPESPLTSGIYFLRARQGGAEARARVVVVE